MTTATKSTTARFELTYDTYRDHGTGYTASAQTRWLAEARAAIRREFGLRIGLPPCVVATWCERPDEKAPDAVLLQLSSAANRGYDGSRAEMDAALAWLRDPTKPREWVEAAIGRACGVRAAYVTVR